MPLKIDRIQKQYVVDLKFFVSTWKLLKQELVTVNSIPDNLIFPIRAMIDLYLSDNLDEEEAPLYYHEMLHKIKELPSMCRVIVEKFFEQHLNEFDVNKDRFNGPELSTPEPSLPEEFKILI